jgi:pyridoxal 5'-phosphate synthase pdxT subunit
MRIGVIGVQGDVSEHVDAVAKAIHDSGKTGEAIAVRRRADLDRIDALTIPGGESTTISKLLVKLDLFDEIVRRATDEAMPIMGTCAGCILLSKDAGTQAEKTKTKLLGLMDMAVDRNAFGRQRESFEADLDVEGLDSPFHCVFIRAPAILRTWGDCQVLARYQERIVLARQKNLIGSAFHPELSGDLRIHRWFLDLV